MAEKEEQILEAEEAEEIVNNEKVEKEEEQDQRDENEILKEELEDIKNSLLRERADFTNFRKRTIKEKAELQSYATNQVLTELVPALDAFDQLIATRESEGEEADLSKFLDGVSLIKKQLLDGLGKFGVEIFDPQGEEFNPNSMEALSKQESDDVEHDIVQQVYQKGYLVSGKVIRAARVAVLTKKADAEISDESESDKKGEE